jgi:putative restriction endonuclease
MAKVFGRIDGIEAGATFPTRKAASRAGVHRPEIAGISGNGREGADSIVLSGGYPDDRDYGEVIIYTGHGGRDGKKQVRDQDPGDAGNAGLRTSFLEQLPVRVIRGNIKTGYTYSGDYLVTDNWLETGIEGFVMVRFRLEKIPELSDESAVVDSSDEDAPIEYRTSTIARRIRDPRVSRSVKLLYSHACQICGTRITASGGQPYAEGAHIRPLGLPHQGKDTLGNILCLCPNHHAQLDLGGITILDDFSVVDSSTRAEVGTLTVDINHLLDRSAITYLRDHHAFGVRTDDSI